MKINFAKNAWTPERELVHAYSYRFEDRPVFTRCDDCIENKADPDGPGGYEYITLLAREQSAPGTRISTRCSFEEDGAPMIVLAKEMIPDPDGVLRFGEYIEIVLYKNGINVWQMHCRDRRVTWKRLLGAEFPVAAGEIHTLSVETGADTLRIEADGHVLTLFVADLYPSFHAGIDACEGINRFYDLSIVG